MPAKDVKSYLILSAFWCVSRADFSTALSFQSMREKLNVLSPQLQSAAEQRFGQVLHQELYPLETFLTLSGSPRR